MKDTDGLKQISGTLAFVPFDCPPDTLVTARSFFIDRMVPDVEVIQLPSKKTGGGTLSYSSHNTISLPKGEPGSRLSRVFKPSLSNPVNAPRPFLDFRVRTPQNWAHFLNNHLPIFFAIATECGLTLEDTLIILPSNTPIHICRAAELFGLETVCTDRPVAGTAIEFECTPWIGIRSIRHEWARAPFVTERLGPARIRDNVEKELPERLFISRRNTRALENEEEVEAFLKRQGYAKIYPEDLSVIDQFRLFEQAESIVAIHGAAIAPLLYISAESRLTTIVELFPCGHMTDVYRVMSHQVGCDWIGVRGKIKPEHVLPAYNLPDPFTKYSLQSFEIDICSLEMAMGLIEKK